MLQNVAVCCNLPDWADGGLVRGLRVYVARVAVCCSVLQCVAVYCSVLQCVAVYLTGQMEDLCAWLACVCSACCSVLQCIAVCRSVSQCVAVCCNVLLCVAVCCSVLATHDDAMWVTVWCSVW